MITDEMVEAAEITFLASFGAANLNGRMRAALEVADAAAWQPIETAPKNGSRFMFTNGHIIGTGLMMGRTPHFAADSWQGERNTVPTHWRPLPEPPATLTRTSGEQPIPSPVDKVGDSAPKR